MKRKKCNNNLKHTYNLFLYLVVITLVITAMSMAKYQSTVSPTTIGTIARWDLKINNQDINSGNILSNILTLVPDTSVNVAAGKMAPGYGGYFDIEIDPSDTEVSFSYAIAINQATLPTDVQIVGYKRNSTDTTSTGATSVVNNTISGSKAYPVGGYTSSDIIRYRIYWVWNDVRANDNIHTATAVNGSGYSVGVSITLTQII